VGYIFDEDSTRRIDFENAEHWEKPSDAITVAAVYQWQDQNTAHHQGLVTHANSDYYVAWGLSTHYKNDQLRFWTNIDGGTYFTAISGTLTVGEYYLTAGTWYSGDNLHITTWTLDGVQHSTAASASLSTGTIAYQSEPVIVGAYDFEASGSYRYLEGNVYEVGLWDLALSDAEILDFFLGRINSVYPVAYMPECHRDIISGQWGTLNGQPVQCPPILAPHELVRRPRHRSVVAGVSGTFAADLPLSTMSASGLAKTTGTFAANNPLSEMSGSGIAKRIGTFAASTPLSEMASSGTRVEIGTFAAETLLSEMAGTGQRVETGSFAADTPLSEMSGSGLAKTTGTLAADTPLSEMAASGAAKTTGTIAADTPLPEMSGTGKAGIWGDFAADTLLSEMSGSGTASTTGTFAADTLLPEMASSGQRVETGTIAAETPLPEMSGTGKVGVSGDFAGETPLSEMAGAGHRVEIGTFAAEVPLTEMNASGQRVLTGSFAADVPISIMAAVGNIPISWSMKYVG
jgi:hypothetical protein